ncbi:hypothetical protein [Microvirga pudoricolor]|uniref:hypothetical protein n=1 Tax=Microvirga pudoricolor TaxID=2778729 RepID=UPI00194E9264|nr:hypothetical protein [Microvirga pudoricolor]MBM6593795.1 hypothetical protein [Microvirga pudoricolor]
MTASAGLRHIIGVLVVTATAPLVTMFLIAAVGLCRGLLNGHVDLAYLLRLIPGLLIGNYIILKILGPPLLVGSTLVAGIIYATGLRTWYASSIGGACFGGCFVLLSMRIPSEEHRLIFAVESASIFLPAGAICGWIYWRIAVAGSKPEPVP